MWEAREIKRRGLMTWTRKRVAELTREENDVEKGNKMNAKFSAKYIWRFTLPTQGTRASGDLRPLTADLHLQPRKRGCIQGRRVSVDAE